MVLIAVGLVMAFGGWAMTWIAGEVYDRCRPVALAIGGLGSGVLYLGIVLLIFDVFLIMLGAHW